MKHRWFLVLLAAACSLFSLTVLVTAQDNPYTAPVPQQKYVVTAVSQVFEKCDGRKAVGMLMPDNVVTVESFKTREDGSVLVVHTGGEAPGCSLYWGPKGRGMSMTPQTVAQVATATQVFGVTPRALPTATSTQPPAELADQIIVEPASRKAFPDEESNPLVTYGQESSPQPGSFSFTLAHGEYQVMAGGPQASAELGIDCLSNCLVVVMNLGAEASYTIDLTSSPFGLKGQLAPEADGQEAVMALAEWFSEALAVRNGGLSAEVHVLMMSAENVRAHFTGTYVPAENVNLTLTDVLGAPAEIIAQAAPTEVNIDWASAVVATPAVYTELDERLRNDWLVYEPADPQCAVLNDTEKSCTTREQQASFGPVTLEPNQAVRASGDGVEFYQRGFTSPLVESPTSRRNLWFVVNATSSQEVALDFSGPFGSDRSYFTLATGNSSWTPEMVGHSASLGVKQFIDPQQTALLTQIDPSGTPLPFTPTPAPNCGQLEEGCTLTDVIVVVFTDEGVFVLVYGWYDQLENNGTYHPLPAPTVNWR